MKANIHTPSLGKIKITDSLFGYYSDIVAQKLLPYQWEILNDRVQGAEKSYCIANFHVAAGDVPGKHAGIVFTDTDAYKWLETVAYCLECGKGIQFEETADNLIYLIERAQEPDGYLNTYFSVNQPDKKWRNLAEGHELYNAGHLIEAAVAYYKATGKDRILNVACRFADLICSVFGEEGFHKGYSGHQEIELALVKLSRVTGQKRYVDMARYFLTVRGGEPNYLMNELKATAKDRIFPEFADYNAEYAQSHLPPIEQTTAEGHAVRAMYMYSAMADVAKEYNDSVMRAACRALWDNVTQKQMYITGGIGSSGYLERFTTDYDLPNDRMYCESCASVGLMMFGQRMAALTGDARYYDVVERALCNTILASTSAEGDKYFYVNPLEVWPDNCLPNTSMAHVKPVRQPWFACGCCPPNVARTLASVGQYIYAQDNKSIYINQFISSSLETRIKQVEVKVTLHSTLMEDGNVKLAIESNNPQPFTIKVRIPSYLKDPTFVFEGKPISPVIQKGYAVLAISHAGVQTLVITGEITPHYVAANTKVRANAGCVALQYGPYVYCLEEVDNGSNLASLYVSPETDLKVGPSKKGLPGAVPTISFTGKRLSSGLGTKLYGTPTFSFTEQKLSAVPYGLWCNRNPGEMIVWLKAHI